MLPMGDKSEDYTIEQKIKSRGYVGSREAISSLFDKERRASRRPVED